MIRNIRKESNGKKVRRSNSGFYAKTEYLTEGLHIVESSGEISINGYRLSGYIAENRKCDKCNHFLIVDCEFDASFCPRCRAWSFPKCDDPCCRYCSVRPDEPLPQLEIHDQQYPKRNLKGLGNLNFIVVDPEEQ